MAKTDNALGGDFLDIAEVSILLRTSPSALYTQRHRGEAPGSLGRRVGRKLLWRRSDIESWFDGGRHERETAVA